MCTRQKSRCGFAIRDSSTTWCGIPFARLCLRPGQWLPFRSPKSSRGAPVDTDAAEVAEKLEEEPAAGARRVSTRVRARHGVPLPASASARSFRLSPPRPEPRTERLPLETALSPYAPAAPRSEADCAAREAASPAMVTPGELPMDLQPLGQVQESFIVAANSGGSVDRGPTRCP